MLEKQFNNYVSIAHCDGKIKQRETISIPPSLHLTRSPTQLTSRPRLDSFIYHKQVLDCIRS